MRDDTSDPASLERSAAYLERAHGLIPFCAQTGSKAPNSYVQGVAPSHLERGQGSHVWDVDGNEYIDYPMARGPIILGHDYAPVRAAVEAQLPDSTTYSLPHPLQVEVAEQLVEMVPAAEMVKFAKNGNDVTAAAAKLCRAHTGNDVIVSQGYHGWPDVWSAAGSGHPGIPDVFSEYTKTFSYNDIESLERLFDAHPDNIAGIVMNPVGTTAPTDDFLHRVREIADREGVPLVFDEIVTGFRFAEGGAQEFFGVTPDLACFAKAISNGYPLSALVGRREIMEIIEDDNFTFSLTYAGEAVSLAAADATLEIIREEPVIEHLFDQGTALRDGFNEIAADHGLADRTSCEGYPPRTRIGFVDADGNGDRMAESLFMQECLKRGILFDSIHFPTFSHTDADVEYTLAVYREAMQMLADAIADDAVADRLEGKPIDAAVSPR